MTETNKLLNEILDSISIIDETLQGIGFEDYINDRRRKIAVTEQLINIAELFDKTVSNYPEIKGTIDRITTEHLYNFISDRNFGIADEIAWKLAKIDLKKIEKSIRILMKELKNN